MVKYYFFNFMFFREILLFHFLCSFNVLTQGWIIFKCDTFKVHVLIVENFPSNNVSIAD